MNIDTELGTTFLTTQQYLRGYQGTTVPATCSISRGLLSFSDTDGPGSTYWDRRTILRSDDLRIAGSSLTGSQEVRQFDTEAEAVMFMQRQQSWFDGCSHTEYRWKGATRAVNYDGSILSPQPVGALLSLGTVTGISSGTTTEFDGWVRQGTVVYGTVLDGDSGMSAADVETDGRALTSAAVTKLAATAVSS